ncbi:MAG: ATP-binding protein, partial [Pseudomonadota bacterium]|nr:ATP-binding protein [Pseudomonadota bacterium]
RQASSDAHATLQLVSAEDVLFVDGDALAIEQILENLVSNGIKYGHGTPVVVSIASEPGSGMALIRVSDSGPGISFGDQARIFERFERAVSSSHYAGGFGVGLWLVRKLSEAMGGSVAVTSAPDRGATFCVALPLHCPGDAT